MGIFSRKEKKELFLVFDIRSRAVGGALFERGESSIPKIIFSATEKIYPEENLSADKLLLSTMKALEIVSGKIYRSGLGAPTRVFCVLSSPWYFSQIRVIDFKKDVPFVFNTALADSLIQNEIRLFEDEHASQYGGTVRAVELKNIKTLLSGYETEKPLGKTATDLKMTIFVSMSGEEVLKKIEDAVGKHFHAGPVKFISSAMASFTAARDIYPEREDFLLVDIGGEVSDIFMVKKNITGASISFPLGLHSFTRGVASHLGIPLHEADFLISLYKDGHAEKSLLRKLGPLMGKLASDWLRQFEESLRAIAGNSSVPSLVYLVVEGRMARFFSEIIQSEQFSQYSLSPSKFEVVIINMEMLHGVAMIKDNVMRDPSLIADSVYINRFLIYPAI